MKAFLVYRCEYCDYETTDSKEALLHDCKIKPNPQIEPHWSYKLGLKYPEKLIVQMEDGAKATYVFVQAEKRNSPTM